MTSTNASPNSDEHFSIPDLIFENRSRLDAMHFDAVDQYGSGFHIIVAKTAHRLGKPDSSGVALLTPSPTPARLLTTDLYFESGDSKGVRQESDLAPFKPKCDVIVNAVAYAPSGKPARKFGVRLTLADPDQKKNRLLIEKTLSICGERSFERKSLGLRTVQSTIKIASLGTISGAPWRLNESDKFTQLPVRYEYTHGGECRINADDSSVENLPKSVLIPRTTEAKADRQSHAGDAVAHDSCPSNPIGRGFVRGWYLTVKKTVALPAPRITYQQTPCDVRHLIKVAGGGELPAPAGFGCVGRGWMPRRALVGNFPEQSQWNEDDVPMLPMDFDFGYWNSAPVDQQCDFLAGGEQFSLTNLCKHDHPSATVDAKGNTQLRFTLPHQAFVLLTTDVDDKLFVLRLQIDTVVVDPDAATVELAWRLCVAADGTLRKSRLIHVTEAAQLERLRVLEEVQETLSNSQAEAIPTVEKASK